MIGSPENSSVIVGPQETLAQVIVLLSLPCLHSWGGVGCLEILPYVIVGAKTNYLGDCKPKITHVR